MTFAERDVRQKKGIASRNKMLALVDPHKNVTWGFLDVPRFDASLPDMFPKDLRKSAEFIKLLERKRQEQNFALKVSSGVMFVVPPKSFRISPRTNASAKTLTMLIMQVRVREREVGQFMEKEAHHQGPVSLLDRVVLGRPSPSRMHW